MRLNDHPLVKQARAAGPAAAPVLDFETLRTLCLEAGADDAWGANVSLTWFFADRLMPFLRAGWTDGDLGFLEANISGGIGYRLKSKNVVGLGLGWGKPSVAGLDDEYTGELYIRLSAFDHLTLVPYAQLVVNPALEIFTQTIA